MSDSPKAVTGPALAIVGAAALLGSTLLRWFSVLVAYPTDQFLYDFGVLALGRRTLHSYMLVGWAFEALTVLAGVAALVAAVYAGGLARPTQAAAALIGCGAGALALVVVASIAFEVADPRSDSAAIGSDLRLGPGAVAAALSAVLILAGGLLTRREVFDGR